MNIDLLNRVAGGRELVEWFGYAPRFHDAEVLSVILDREDSGSCAIKLHGFEMTNEVDTDGYFVLTKHVVVTFVFRDLTETELGGFNTQNALMGITIERGLDGQFRMEIEPAWGLGGIVEGRELEISFEPGLPTGSQYLKRGQGLPSGSR